MSSWWPCLKTKFLLLPSGIIVFAVGIALVSHGVIAIAKDVTTPAPTLYFAQSTGVEDGEAVRRITRLNTEEIRYSQATYSETGTTVEGDKYAVEGNAQWLREHPDQDLPWGGPIRVFRKEAFMDEWGPMTGLRYTGDPRNLVNGQIYTLDHRSLVAYKRAGRKSIPVEWVDLKAVRDERWEFSTPDGGISIVPKR